MASLNQLPKIWKYDAFLNLNPEDFEGSFVADLYKRLEDKGINAFVRDSVKLQKGETISTEILEAIEESRIAITIFSGYYVSSTWCLEELTKIMECVDMGQEFFVVLYRTSAASMLPLFDLARDQANFKGYDREKARRWKDALSKAAGHTARLEEYDYHTYGQVLCDNEECSHQIVDKFCQVGSFAKYPVGIRSRIEEVKSLLNVEPGGVHYVGLWGMAGVGKTTIARELFNEISCQFEGSYFLASVRRVLKKHGPGGLQYLQQKLLSQILKKHSLDVANFARGGKITSQMLRFKKVLVVVDDLDDSRQLEYLAGNRDWFGDGSRVITTSRNFDSCGKHDVLYRVPELTSPEALELFSWHTFQQRTPVKDFEELSCCVVDYAKGLPLSLEVLGSFLYKQVTVEQRSALYRLKDFRDGKIVRLLSSSLDALGNEYKNMFLHIACFFRGKKKEDVITVLDRLGFKSVNGIDVLKRSFLYISEGKIEIHDLIAQMGQQVARDAEQGKPWNCSRLWHGKDVKTVLSANQIARTLTFPMAPQNESIKKWKYDAFLSFRGDDTRNNFVAHLYKRLEDIGIDVFKDDVKLERGKFISTELLKAIEESRTAIIIFSEDYASSTWCLEELSMIMDCVDKKEQKAYPVFYNVKPSDIRMQGESSSFAKALEKHVEDLKASFEKLVTKHEADFKCGQQKVLANKTDRALRKKDEANLKDNLEKVQRWKDALRRAAGIAGLDVRKTANGNEAESIDKIINDNFSTMHHTISATEKYLVGIESRMGGVESLMKFRSGDVCFVGIWGIGGVGKTTVARKFFDKISHQFQGSCFLANVREEAKKHGLMYLQKTLL